MSYKVGLRFEVTKDDEPFFDAPLVWHDMPYEAVLAFEAEILKLLATTHSWGELKASQGK